MQIPENYLPGLLGRFVSKIQVVDDCWRWTGAINSKGYPQIRVKGRIEYAHRIAHELFIGEVADGMQVHHKCQCRQCVNPKHLEQVTPEVNRYLQAIGIGEIPTDGIPF